MSSSSPHDLVAAYALDALDPEAEREFERHLADCEDCRGELERLRDVAAALAAGTEGREPPPELRGRVIERVRREREAAAGAGVPPRPSRFRRPLVAALGGAAALIAATAAALAVWVATGPDDDGVVSVLGDPGARIVELEGAEGRLVIAPDGEAVLVAGRLPELPAGRVYEVWVIRDGNPQPAALYRPGEDGSAVVRLERPVPAGATVAVTVEREGGANAPTGEPVLSAST